MDPLTVVVDDRHRLHDPPYELNAGRAVTPVWERPARADALRAAVTAAGHAVLGAAPHGVGPITAVHDPALVDHLADAWRRWRDAGGPEVLIPDTFRWPRLAGGGRPPASPLGAAGWWCFDTATPLVAGSYEAARAAVDVALTGADRLRAGDRLVYGLCRPPGHHAGRDYYGGFCFLNNAAVAARSLTDGGRVAVLDVDFHHGNGTQDIFWTSADVVYASLHADPDRAYPFLSGAADEAGEGDGRGATINVPLALGTDDAAYLAALEAVCAQVDGLGAAALVVSLGFDTFGGDPIGGFALTTDAFAAVGARIRGLGLPTLVVQEGGYAIDALGANLTAFLTGLRGG